MSELDSGIAEELAFWRGAIQRYRQNPDKVFFGTKLDPDRPIQPPILKRVMTSLAPGQTVAKVLDVGCGPVSTIGKRAANIRLEITGLDPLGDLYGGLFEEENLIRPHRIVDGVAEEANKHFPDGYFDYVHAENSLDHCQDPTKALSQLRAVCKPDAVIFIQVFINEGESNHYSGFHQWNFDTYNGEVIFWRPGQIHFLSEVLPLPVRHSFGEVEISHGGQAQVRKLLKFEIHNTDMTNGAKDVGPFKARYLPDYRSVLLQPTEAFDPADKCYLHGRYHDRDLHVESFAWEPGDTSRVLKLPDGDLKAIMLGQATPLMDDLGTPSWEQKWSAFLPL